MIKWLSTAQMPPPIPILRVVPRWTGDVIHLDGSTSPSPAPKQLKENEIETVDGRFPPELARALQGRIVLMPLWSLSPAKLNAKIYRPIVPEEPENIELTESIKTHDVLVAVSITKDLVIQSGHRRVSCASSAGLKEIPCIILDYDHTDPRFQVALAENNRQRTKTRDEKFRESIVLSSQIDPAQAHRRLVEHREKAAEAQTGTLEVIELRKFKPRAELTYKTQLVEAAYKVLRRNLNFLPFTVRQLHIKYYI